MKKHIEKIAAELENKETSPFFDKVEFGIKIALITLAIVLFSVQLARAQDFVVDNGIPKHTNKFEKPTAVTCWDDDLKKPVTEVFTPPTVLRDFGTVKGLLNSPIEANRLVDGLKTCGITQWHYWLLKEIVLAASLRQYAGCGDSLSLVMQMNGEMGINDPRHPFYPILKAQTEYLVAFNGVEPFEYEHDPSGRDGVPIPGVRHYKEHIKAAIISINITSHLNSLCQQTKNDYVARFFNDFQKKPIKKPTRK